MAFVKVCNLSDLDEEEIFRGEPEGGPVLALYLVDGQPFATSDICTHGEASLTEDGYVEGGIVVCSWHDGAFDIRTGEACRLPCHEPLKSYPTELRGDEVWVDI